MSNITRTTTISKDATYEELRYLMPVDLYDRPTISQTQTHDLKFQSAKYRVWYSRMRPQDYDDNVAFNNERIQIEEFRNGKWILMPGKFEARRG